MITLKPCPYCGNTKATLKNIAYKPRIWWVQCDECWTTANYSTSKTVAIDTWNKKPMKSTLTKPKSPRKKKA